MCVLKEAGEGPPTHPDNLSIRGFAKGVAGTVSLPIFPFFFRFLPFTSVFFRFFPVFFPFSSVFFRFLPFVSFLSIFFPFLSVFSVSFRFFPFLQFFRVPIFSVFLRFFPFSSFFSVFFRFFPFSSVFFRFFSVSFSEKKRGDTVRESRRETPFAKPRSMDQTH